MITSSTVTKVVGAACACLLVTVSCGAVSATGAKQATSTSTSTTWQKSKLSQAVLTDANQAMLNLIIDNQSGHLSATDFASAATALQIMADHFQEIGLNAALQKQILENESALLNFHPSDAQIDSYWMGLESHGIKVSVSQVRNVMDPSSGSRQQFLTTVEKVGMYGVEMQIVSYLRLQGQQVASSGGYASSRLKGGSAHLLKVILPVCDACILTAGGCIAGDILIPLSALVDPLCGAGFSTCVVCAL